MLPHEGAQRVRLARIVPHRHVSWSSYAYLELPTSHLRLYIDAVIAAAEICRGNLPIPMTHVLPEALGAFGEHSQAAVREEARGNG